MRPEAVAVKNGARRMSYAELDLLSNRVANHLRRHALKLEEAVVILLPASGEFLAGVLGVLKAGGTYVPIDADLPTKRLEFLLNDSVSRLVLSDEAGRQRLREWPGTVLNLAQILSLSEAAAEQAPGLPLAPGRRAYITYTSGSTGQPKGVEIEHQALTNLVCYYHQRLQLTAKDRSTMLAYVAFDASVADIWPVLCAGGSIAIPPKGILLNPDGLIQWLAAEEITLTFIPTGLAEILFARTWSATMPLRFLITGGDRLRVHPPIGLPFAVINGYGPTENTVFSTWSVVTPGAMAPPPPIGRPLDNTTAYVLDAQLQPVPVNVAGELYLGGEQVARGYLGRDDLTRERFLPDPFADKSGARMYRTGDWVQWLPSGELDFIGRKDGQIQIRGRRVELGEIEAALFAHAAVRQVCCVPWLDEGMPAGVIAHIVPQDRRVGLADELRAQLSAQLPDYMVPAEFVWHERLPLTAQGKLDRAALTALQAVSPAALQEPSREEALEQALERHWKSLLPAANSSPADTTFAALGGDSLLAIKLMLGVEAISGQRLEVSTFLVQPTFAGLCEVVKSRMIQNEFEPVLALRKHGTRPPLFCLYGHDGDIGVYFDLVEALGDDQPVFGIRSPALKELSSLPDSIAAAAAAVVRCIRKIQPQGAPVLVGYSWAGPLAFETARQLAETEGLHCCTALIGTTAPMRTRNPIFRLTHFMHYSPLWLWHLIMDQQHCRRRLTRWREMLQGTKRSLLTKPRLPVEEWAWAASPISRHLIGLMEKYEPRTKPDIAVQLFREQKAFVSRPHPLHVWPTNYRLDGGWNHWTGRPNAVHWVAGDHVSIMKQPAVGAIARTLRRSMDEQSISNPASRER